MYVRRRAEIEPYVTRDGSTIREWAGPGYSPAANQSLAEATVAPGEATIHHYHRAAEELYLVTAGRGLLWIGEEEREIAAGDCTVIPPGEPHRLLNTGAEDLVVVCASSPAYSHEDTVLLEKEADAGAGRPA
jgi:mannose-6-phosphate isomerase-like protein (cupin superfamily)